MIRRASFLTSFLSVMAFAALPALAQGGSFGSGGPGGGGGGGGGDGKNPPPGERPLPWFQSVDEVSRWGGNQERHILLWAHPPGKTDEPAFFKDPKVRAAIWQGGWILVRRAFDKEDAELKRLKVTAASTLVGMDRHANDFKRGPGSAETLASIVKQVPPAVKEYVKELARDWASASKALEGGQEDRAVSAMVEIVSPGRRGWKEIVDSQAKLREIGDRRLAEIEKLLASDAENALRRLRAMVETFKGCSPAAAAEVRLAAYERDHDAVGSAVGRLTRVSKLEAEMFKPEAEAATRGLTALLESGRKRIDEARKTALSGDLAGARAALKKIREDFEGSAVAAEAREALKAIE